MSWPTLVRSRCSGVAGPGPSPRALLLGDRLLPPRLSSAFCPLILVEPGLTWSYGKQDLPEGFQGPLPHNPPRPLPEGASIPGGMGCHGDLGSPTEIHPMAPAYTSRYSQMQAGQGSPMSTQGGSGWCG